MVSELMQFTQCTDKSFPPNKDICRGQWIIASAWYDAKLIL